MLKSLTRRCVSHFVDFEAGETWETVRDVEGLVDVQLVAKVVEQLVRGAREFASGGEGQMSGNQEVGQVFGGDLSGDGGVVAGGAGVFEDGFVGGGEPQ